MRPLEFITASLFAGWAVAQSGAGDLEGFSKAGLANLNSVMKGKAGKGLVSLLARNGKILQYESYGTFKGGKLPKNSIWNIMSMTKPLSGACMMTFFEEGRFKLDDPVSKHLPQVAKMKVNGQAQKTTMTMAMLMSHSAGFPGLIAASGATLKSGVEKILTGKLAAQPGSKWAYGPGVEIQGYLMEKWAKKEFDAILIERILKPLGMNDTGFFMSGEKRNRVVGGKAPATRPKRIIPSYGLHSTAMDYYKFCQMMLNNGYYNNHRFLQPSSVKLMRTNVLKKGVAVTMGGGKGVGFGLNVAVIVDPPASEPRPKGCYYWGGAFGTIFWIDPTYNLTWIGMLTGSAQTGSGVRGVAAKAIYADLKKSGGKGKGKG